METSQSPVIIITGASSGIGEAASRRLFRSGFRLVLGARRAERLQSLQAELEPASIMASPEPRDTPRILTVAADITKTGDRERLVSEAMRAFGRIDGLVNN